jgi:hypothetical protein
MRVRRIAGWILIVIGVLIALYPIGILLQWLGGTMMSETFEEAVGYGVSHVVRATIESLIIGGILVLWGRSLVRKASDQVEPPSPPVP